MINTSEDVENLKKEIKRLGEKPKEGQPGVAVVKFGILVRDDRVNNKFEALNAILRSAKRNKILTFDGEILLQGAHDNTDVVLLQDENQ